MSTGYCISARTELYTVCPSTSGRTVASYSSHTSTSSTAVCYFIYPSAATFSVVVKPVTRVTRVTRVTAPVVSPLRKFPGVYSRRFFLTRRLEEFQERFSNRIKGVHAHAGLSSAAVYERFSPSRPFERRFFFFG